MKNKVIKKKELCSSLCRGLIFLVILAFNSCGEKPIEEWRHVEIYPKDRSQTITIITKDDKRYFMDGKHNDVPRDGYLLLDISELDPLGDGVSVCWKDSNHRWKIASAYAKLIENKLDTSKFLYSQPKGEYGEPTSEGYLGQNCGGVLIREDLKPRGNVSISYIRR